MAPIFIRLTTALALSGATFATAASAAAPAEQPPRLEVRTNDLDLASDRGARILDRRIHRAAMAVCPEYDFHDIGAMPAIRACRDNAVASAQQRAQLALAKARTGGALAANTATAPVTGD